MNHLLNNQINHTVNKMFLNKEHLDCEYNSQYSKLEYLKKYSEDFFNEKN